MVLGEGASARAQRVTTGFDGLRFEIHHGGRSSRGGVAAGRPNQCLQPPGGVVRGL